MRRLRLLVDLTATIIRHRPLTRAEAEQAVRRLRDETLRLFPGKDATFDLIYAPRFRRLIEDRFGAA